MTLTPTVIREYDEQAPETDETETATFAVGCFWGPDAEFGAVDGVVRTRVGYAGGTRSDPSYHDLGDHTEAFQVDYVPKEVSYGDLLERAFRNHDPHRQVRKTQYQNIVFTETSAQQDTVGRYLNKNGLSPDGIETRIEELSGFHPAEDYHQKYNLRSRGTLIGEFEDAGYDEKDIRESSAAAKLNGYASGHEVDTENGLELPDDRTVR